ncbi:MAG: hypothetical protein JWR45_1928 [Blastococcus sp.]|jgi:uncharacterized membrane protein|nr:hypothetical protein [Blastococcus sp.]
MAGSARAPTGRSGGQDVAPQRLLSWRRLLLSLALGAVAGVAVAVLRVPELAVLAAWTVAAGALLFWVWRLAWPQDASGTERMAEQEGRTRATDTAVLGAAGASLAAVVVALVRSSSSGPAAVAAVVLGLVVVVLSWALVNTVFAFKYARLYYIDEHRGIDFGQETPPAYSDFAYLAFTVGMSFAVSDTEPAGTRVRKVALGHALLSYLFGTVVLAVAINLVTNLGQS